MLARCLCVLELLLRKERSITFEGEKKGGKGSLTYDVKYIDTDLTECTKPPQSAYSNLLLSNTRALNKKNGWWSQDQWL